MMTDGTKTNVWEATWMPWGEVHSVSGAAPLDASFPGHWFQIEGGLHYNWHRHYDPALGRYTQADPLGFVDGPSVYAYAGNSPQMFVDPDGRIIPLLAGAAFGAAFEYFTNPCATFGDIAFAGALGSIGGGLGFAKFGIRAAGTEFSHFVPARFARNAPNLIRRPIGSKLNGNFVSPRFHSATDRFRFLRRQRSSDAIKRFSRLPVLPQLLRTPAWLGGGLLGGAAGAVVSGEGCLCQE